MITLDFLNKNLYRKYPFRATSSHTFTNGKLLPQSLITSIQISTIYTYRKVYVDKIFVKNNYLSLLLREVDTNIALGSFSGKIIEANQTLLLEPIVTQISGTVTIGSLAALSAISGTNYLSSTDGRLEDSTIFCFTPPTVTSITNGATTTQGFINLKTDNITLTEESPSILLSVTNTKSILSKNDKSGETNNCPTPLIRKINTVSPDEQGNIDIYGIEPVSISIDGDLINISTPDLEITDICPEKLKRTPPVDNTDTYYSDISTETTPEWQTWG